MARRFPLEDDPLALWRSIAELSPRALPEPGFARPCMTVKDYLREHRLPWDPAAGHWGEAGGTWRHTVYAGLVPYRTLLVRAGLEFGPAPAEEGPGAASGLTPLFALRVGQDGAADPASLELSRACWAALSRSGFGRAVTADAEADGRRWRTAMVAVLRARGVLLVPEPGSSGRAGSAPRPAGAPGAARLLDHEDLLAMVEETHRVFEAGALRSERLLRSPVRVLSLLEADGRPGAPALPLIDHPSAAPLAEAAGATRFRQAAAGLLGIGAAEPREEAASPLLVYSAVAPKELPLGVVVGTGEAAVATQFSVNRALSQLGGGEGLWAVPASLSRGLDAARTREMLLSALVTRRGRALAELPDPAEAFDPEPADPAGSRRVHPLHPDLTGCGVLRARPLEELPGGAGGLGVRAGILPGMEECGLYPGLVPGEGYDAVEAVDVVLSALPEAPAEPTPAQYEEWDRLAGRVLAAQDRVEALLAVRQRYHEAVPMLMRAQHQISQTARQLSGVRGAEQSLEGRLLEAEAEHRAAWERAHGLSDAIAGHLSAAPGVVRRTVTLGRSVPPWRHRLEELRLLRDEAERAEEASGERREALQRELDRVRAHAAVLREELREAAETVRGLQEELDAYPHRSHAVDQDWLAGDWQEDTASSPWLDAEVQDARAEAYRSAALLHGLAARLRASEVREGLLLARDLLLAAPGRSEGTAEAGPGADAAAAAWQVLLTLLPDVEVPVELLPRLCAPLGPHRLDWVILSDADRTDPGVAYAALRRARRAVLLPAAERGTPPPSPADPAPFDAERPRPPRQVRHHCPTREAQERLAQTEGCSPAWAPAWADALSLARRQSDEPDEGPRRRRPEAGV